MYIAYANKNSWFRQKDVDIDKQICYALYIDKEKTIAIVGNVYEYQHRDPSIADKIKLVNTFCLFL